MARWYPKEYDDKEADSFFKQYYERLLKMGVVFPEDKYFAFINKTDEDIFQKNYERFMEYQ